jgi:hypothetical protein
VPVAIGLDAELVRLVDRLVDVIAVRESYEPEVAGWDTGHLIRRLERELAQAWPGDDRRSERSLHDMSA